MTPPRRARAGESDTVLALISAGFAGMEGRIDPPSSVHLLTAAALAEAEVWVIGDPAQAAMVLTPQAGTLYLGKLAVAAGARRRGLARALVARAALRARELGLGSVTLQTRVELVENHEAFAAMGFHEVGRTAHAGYDRPTSITYRLGVTP